jgi:hypothetical protein
LIEVGVSPALPAAKTTTMLRSCAVRVATLIGLFGSMPSASRPPPQELLMTRML